MTENSDPLTLLVQMEDLLADLDRLGADIAAARLSEVIDAFRKSFNLNAY